MRNVAVLSVNFQKTNVKCFYLHSLIYPFIFYFHCKFKSLETVFNVFELSLFCSPRLYLFDQKYSKYYYNVKQLFSM